MTIKTLKNLFIAKRLNVSHPTIGRWIDEALRKNNNLMLHQEKDRFLIIDNEHNWAELSRLKELGLKYRNRVGYEKVTVSPELYKILNESQVVELITSLENNNQIPLKFTYLGEGAQIWNNFVLNTLQEQDFYISKSNVLLEMGFNFIKLIANSFDHVNIIDIGTGNGYTIKPLIDTLITTQKKISYLGIDESSAMLEIVLNNLKKWYPNMDTNTIIGDIDYMVIRDHLFSLKLKYPNSCNIVLLLGSTIGNMEDTHRVLKNIQSSIGQDDFFVFDNVLDLKEFRTDFRTLNNPIYQPITLWIPKMLGFQADFFEIENKYDPTTNRRLQVMKLIKDVDLVFKLDHYEKILNFLEGEEIVIWHHYKHDLRELTQQLTNADLEIKHLDVFPDNSNVLVICESSKNKK